MSIRNVLLCIGIIMVPVTALCSAGEHSDSLYKGFTQFLGSLYQYECKPLLGGQMGSIQQCTVNGKKYVARIINAPLATRRSEVLTHLSMAAQNIAPRIYYYDQDDYSLVIMEYIESKTLSWEQTRNANVLQCVAQKIRAIQAGDAVALGHNKKMDIFDLIVRGYERIRTKHHIVDHSIFEQALRKAKVVYQKIESRRPLLVLSHNDLHPRNMFFINNDIVIIDWELIGLNYDFFDLALYSLYSCLTDKHEYDLLSHYLQRDPSVADLQYLKEIKLLIRLYGALWNLSFLDELPEDISLDMVKNFDHYGKIFIEDYSADSSLFWFEFSMSLLREFFQEYERFEKDNAIDMQESLVLVPVACA